MVKQNSVKRVLGCAALSLVLLFSLAVSAFAAPAPCKTGKAAGTYRHPVTGIIEDSGGEDSEALGQSMVENMVDGDALVETASNGKIYLSVRFHLMSNISEVDLQVQKRGDSGWIPAVYESSGKGEDSEDFRVEVPAEDAILRAQCFVDAMGRSVVFYVTAADFTDGNAGGFAQIDADYTGPAASKEDKPAGDNVLGKDTVGLVTGGTNTHAAGTTAGQTQPQVGDGMVTRVEISGQVWIMFFVLAFCAQLLACLVFWGLKSLVERGGKHSAAAEEVPESKISQAEEDDFDTDFLDSDWQE